MSGHRIERINEDIKRELSAIFRELKDPRVTESFVSIVRVEVTNDLSYCNVYVSAIEGLDKAKISVEGLKSANGYIKRELGHRLDSIEYGANISKILNDLNGDRE